MLADYKSNNKSSSAYPVKLQLDESTHDSGYLEQLKADMITITKQLKGMEARLDSKIDRIDIENLERKLMEILEL